MHQLAPGLTSALFRPQPIRKPILDNRDLQTIATMICDELRDGIDLDFIAGRKRSDLLRFLHTLASKCEYRYYDPAQQRVRTRVAALLVYTVNGIVVGFAILAEAFSDAAAPGIELLLLGVVPSCRGHGYGAALLDLVIQNSLAAGFRPHRALPRRT